MVLHILLDLSDVLIYINMFCIFVILTQRAYIGNGEKSCFILQQIHWAEMRDVI